MADYSVLPDHIARVEFNLRKAGWPFMSSWWIGAIREMYDSKCTEGICRVGVGETAFGEHVNSPGDVAQFAIISAERGQARDRIVMIKKICDTLIAAQEIENCKGFAEHVEFSEVGRAIKCFTASLSGVVGFSGIGAILDEVCRWNDEGVNPAREVIESIMPTFATQPNAKLWMISSPWSTLDEHARRYDLGDSDERRVFHAETWIANPTLSEERTHQLEPDQQAWEREYAAKPMASDDSKFFSAELVMQATRTLARGSVTRTAAGADYAFVKDSSATVVCDQHSDGRVSVRIGGCRQWRVTSEPLRPSAVISESLVFAEGLGAEQVVSDTHYVELVREEIEATSLELTSFVSSMGDIAKAYTDVRVMLGRGEIDLSDAPETLITELKETIGKVTGGGLKIEHPRRNGSHGDLARAFVSAVWGLKQSVGGGDSAGSERRERAVGGAGDGDRRFGAGRHAGTSGNPEWTDLPPDDD
jgi:hypothetical protein